MENVETGYVDKHGIPIYSNSKLKCISEKYEGTVSKINKAWYTNCRGWGDEPLSELDEDDLEVIN